MAGGGRLQQNNVWTATHCPTQEDNVDLPTEPYILQPSTFSNSELRENFCSNTTQQTTERRLSCSIDNLIKTLQPLSFYHDLCSGNGLMLNTTRTSKVKDNSVLKNIIYDTNRINDSDCSNRLYHEIASASVTTNKGFTNSPHANENCPEFQTTFIHKAPVSSSFCMSFTRLSLIVLLLLSDCLLGSVSATATVFKRGTDIANFPSEAGRYPTLGVVPTYAHIRSVRQVETQASISNVSLSIKNNFNITGQRPPREPDSCEVSNIKCALRGGCGMALQKYMLDCADLINGHTSECEPHCQDSLLILTSTPEGRALMDCKCSDGYCSETKQRMEVCRAAVVAARALGGQYSCTLAHLVCSADTSCATAINYYDMYCRKMFSGRSCSPRCNNSIAILQRQEKAAQLETCACDGSEPFDCAVIKANMARLCFHRVDEKDREHIEEETNEIDTTRIRVKSDRSSANSPTMSMINISIVSVMLYMMSVFILNYNIMIHEL